MSMSTGERKGRRERERGNEIERGRRLTEEAEGRARQRDSSFSFFRDFHLLCSKHPPPGLSSEISAVRYMMFRRISVVMTTMAASVLREVSPVCRPQRVAPKRLRTCACVGEGRRRRGEEMRRRGEEERGGGRGRGQRGGTRAAPSINAGPSTFGAPGAPLSP